MAHIFNHHARKASCPVDLEQFCTIAILETEQVSAQDKELPVVISRAFRFSVAEIADVVFWAAVAGLVVAQCGGVSLEPQAMDCLLIRRNVCNFPQARASGGVGREKIVICTRCTP